MNAHETQSLNAINRAIAELEKTREAVLARIPLSSRAQENEWVIDNRTNMHYQMHSISSAREIVNLKRHGDVTATRIGDFDKYFTLATPTQVENHLRHLKNKGYIPGSKISLESVQLPEFYMITVEGKSGAIVRHPDFQTAANEATRLAKKCNHRAHIMGVVGIVEPVQVQQPIIEYQLIRK
jgi:hypothetical protein